MQPHVGESCRPATPQLVLPPESLGEPMPRVAVDGSVGRVDWFQTDGAQPTQQRPVRIAKSLFPGYDEL